MQSPAEATRLAELDALKRAYKDEEAQRGVQGRRAAGAGVPRGQARLQGRLEPPAGAPGARAAVAGVRRAIRAGGGGGGDEPAGEPEAPAPAADAAAPPGAEAEPGAGSGMGRGGGARQRADGGERHGKILGARGCRCGRSDRHRPKTYRTRRTRGAPAAVTAVGELTRSGCWRSSWVS